MKFSQSLSHARVTKKGPVAGGWKTSSNPIDRFGPMELDGVSPSTSRQNNLSEKPTRVHGTRQRKEGIRVAFTVRVALGRPNWGHRWYTIMNSAGDESKFNRLPPR